MEFLTVEDREVYLNHPAHINYATNKILPNLVNGINSLLFLIMNFDEAKI